MTKSKNLLRLTVVPLVTAAISFGAIELFFRLEMPESPSKGNALVEYEKLLDSSMAPTLYERRDILGKECLFREKRFGHPTTFTPLILNKSPHTKRVLVLGESSAELLGTALDRIARTQSRAGYEVMNYGIGAASLEIVENRLDEALSYQPDAIIFVFGNNLFYHHHLPPRALFPVFRLLERSRFFHYVFLGFEERLPHSYLDDPENRLRKLADFLTRLDMESRKRGIPLVLCTMPSNLWFLPYASSYDLSDQQFLEAVFQYRSGRRRQAITLLEAAAKDHADAWWQFQIADWLFKEGEYGEAKSHFIKALDLDPMRRRTSIAVNDLIRRIAVERNLTLVDANLLAVAQAPHGIPGWDSFIDDQHANRRLFLIWAKHCLDAIPIAVPNGWNISSMPFRDTPPSTEHFQHAIGYFEQWSSSGQPLYIANFTYLAEQHIDWFESNGETAIDALISDGHQRSLFLLALAEALFRAGRRSQALAVNEHAQEASPESPIPFVQSALFHLDANDPAAAVKELRLALAKDPGNAWANFLLTRMRSRLPPE